MQACAAWMTRYPLLPSYDSFANSLRRRTLPVDRARQRIQIPPRAGAPEQLTGFYATQHEVDIGIAAGSLDRASVSVTVGQIRPVHPGL